MEVRELCLNKAFPDVKVIGQNRSLREAAQSLVANQIGSLIVIGDNARLVGIVSERDLIQVIAEYETGLDGKLVSDIMTKSVITCGSRDSVFDVLSVMKLKAIRHIPVIEDGELRGVLSIRDLIGACEVLRVQANTDSLTGLPNRRDFFDKLATELERSRRYRRPLSVSVIDIDHFKKVNDTYGHAAGDEVLQSLASIVKASLRSIDLFARLGGEEFGVFLPETDRLAAMEVAEKLRRKIAETAIMFGDHRINITASFGVTVLDNEDENAEVLVKRADEAMYRAKKAGRNRTVFLGSGATFSDVA